MVSKTGLGCRDSLASLSHARRPKSVYWDLEHQPRRLQGAGQETSRPVPRRRESTSHGVGEGLLETDEGWPVADLAFCFPIQPKRD